MGFPFPMVAKQVMHPSHRTIASGFPARIFPAASGHLSRRKPVSFRAAGRKRICDNDIFELREVITPCGKADNLDSGNTFLWSQPIDWLRIYRPPASLSGRFLPEK
jgi:hypothetical protein